MKRIAIRSIFAVGTALLFLGSAFAGNDIETPTMEIGTNFWDIGWGGKRNQPFKTPYNEFQPAEDPWNPEFLKELEIYTCFRLMDWNKTNSPEREWQRGNDYHRHGWEGRVKPNDSVQRPMAYEWMIDLCNRTRRDMWITVPHVVDDVYVRSLALLIKEKLSPDLKCYVEWSNETWNGSFTQAEYSNDKGQQLPDNFFEGFKYPKTNRYYVGQLYHGVRTLEIHKIFVDVFGGRERLVLVMGGSMGHAFYKESHLFAVQSPVINPDGLIPDAYALAPYIGHGLQPDDSQVFEKLGGEVLRERLRIVAKVSSFMKENGIEMICYEGGQHIKHTLPGVIPLQKRPEMFDLYTKYLDALSEHMTHFNHYTHTGGSWGAKEFIGEDESQAPKYRALKAWSEKAGKP